MRAGTLLIGIVLGACLLLPALGLVAGLAEKPVLSISVLVTSDIHGRVQEDRIKGQIGYARLQGYVNFLRSRGNIVYLLDAGDFITGSETVDADKGGRVAGLMRHMGYAGLVPGNHDFDYNTGQEPLFLSRILDRLRGAGANDFFAVCANLTYNGKPISGIHTEAQILHRTPAGESAPFRIVVAGITTPYALLTQAPAAVAGYGFGALPEDWRGSFDDEATKRNVLAMLRESLAGVQKDSDIVIVVSHIGDDPKRPSRISGKDIAAMPDAGIDFVVDGHSHKGTDVELVNGVRYVNVRAYSRSFAEITINRYADGRLETRLRQKTWADLGHVRPDPAVAGLIRELWPDI